MVLYVFVAVLLILGTFDLKRSKLLYRIDMIVLFAFTAFRDANLGGTDAYYYQKFYNSVPVITHLSGFDSPYGFGYTLISSIAKTISDDYICFQVIYAACTVVLLHFIIKELGLKYNERCLFLFSFYCYRFLWSFWVTLRQNFANLFFWLLVIKLYKLYQENQKRIKKNALLSRTKFDVLLVLTVGLPVLFHTSAYMNIILVPVLFALRKVKTRYKMTVVPLASMALYLFGGKLMGNFIRIAALIDQRYAGYVNRENSNANVVNYVFRLLFFCLYCYFFEKNDSNLKEFVMDSSIILVLLGSINSGLMMRCYELYGIGMYAGMAYFPRYFKKSSIRLAMIIYIIGMLFIFIRYLIVMDSGAYLPYKFYW